MGEKTQNNKNKKQRVQNNQVAGAIAAEVTWLVPVVSADLSFHGLALAGFDARLRYTSTRYPAGACLSVGP